MKRIAYLAAAGALVATSGLGAWTATAATAADAPATHVRVTDRHGADDPVGHHRHHGADDGAGHHRTARAGATAQRRHAEPGDDHGGQGNEPGDDHGRHGHDGGRHHGGDHGSDG